MYLIQSEVLCYVMYIMSNVGVVCKVHFSGKGDTEDKEIKVDIQLYHSLLLC